MDLSLRWTSLCAVLLVAVAGGARAQTTQGLIFGRVLDADTGGTIAEARVSIESVTTGQTRRVRTRPSGFYSLPPASPGLYQIVVEKSGYERRAIYRLTLSVAGYLNIDFQLRPLRSLWEKTISKSVVFGNHSVLSYLGPDVDPSYSGSFDPEPADAGQLEPSLSDVIEPKLIAGLPLAGRDIYAALALMPGVTTDTATGRSLGLSSGGQRPTSSNFLLDGIEYNNHLISGPAITLPPESVQEYRVSTNNFSAEFGRTSGQIANAVTGRGGQAWHGQAFFGIRNEALDANSFQDNAKGVPLGRTRETEAGGAGGGPLIRGTLFEFFALENFRGDGLQDPQLYTLPTPSFIAALPAGGIAARLFAEHPLLTPFAAPPGAESAIVNLRPTVMYRRWSGIERLDANLSEKHRLLARLAGNRVERPDFMWSPYGNSGLGDTSLAASTTLESAWTSRATTEIRAGFTGTALAWRNPQEDLPLVSIAGTPLLLPGAVNGFGGFAFDDHSKTFELAGNFVHVGGRNTVKAGGDLLWRTLGFSLQTKAEFIFLDEASFGLNPLDSFRNDIVDHVIAPVSRIAHAAGSNQVPSGGGRFRYGQYSGYVQDDFRWTRRLTVYAGVRVDSFRPPAGVGGQSAYTVTLGGGENLPAQVSSAVPGVSPGGAVFATDGVNVAARAGFALALDGNGRLTLRGGYGNFYDRGFDNFWTDAIFNDFVAGSGSIQTKLNYLQPLASIFAGLPLMSISPYFDLTTFARPLHTPRTDSGFVGLQYSLSPSWSLETDGVRSAGHDLISTDIVNRGPGRANPAIREDINYRANQAYSNYSALIVASRFRSKRAVLNASYTWSHTVDNQSDPLLGDFFDLGFANQVDRTSATHYYAGFSNEFDPNSDRGNADFDQRHSLVALGTWSIPDLNRKGWAGALARDWTASAIYAIRSGLPYTVYNGENCFPICNIRPNLVGQPLLASPVATPGSRIVLDQTAFAPATGPGTGNLGRNTFHGPLSYNLDLSVARTLHAGWLGEAGRITVRADWFNALNHANWSNPDAFLGPPAFPNHDFGRELKGQIAAPGFPALTPLNGTARQIELRLRIEF